MSNRSCRLRHQQPCHLQPQQLRCLRNTSRKKACKTAAKQQTSSTVAASHTPPTRCKFLTLSPLFSQSAPPPCNRVSPVPCAGKLCGMGCVSPAAHGRIRNIVESTIASEFQRVGFSGFDSSNTLEAPPRSTLALSCPRDACPLQMLFLIVHSFMFRRLAGTLALMSASHPPPPPACSPCPHT